MGGSALTAADYCVILDKHDDIAGTYPVRDDRTIDAANSFHFVSEYSGDLFYLRTEPIDASKYAEMSGYYLCHRRLGPCPNECIRKTIPYLVGLDEFHSHRFDPHEKCPACMMGRSHLQNKPKRKDRSNSRLGRLHMDIFSSSVLKDTSMHLLSMITAQGTDGCMV